MSISPPSHTHTHRLDGAPTSPHASPTSPRPLPPNQAAALAALARSLGGLSLRTEDQEDCLRKSEKREWLRLLNDDLLPRCTKCQALVTLELLVKLMSNVLALPDDSDGKERERTFSTRNAKIKVNVVDVIGAEDLLIQSGFRRKVVDFEPKYTFPLLPSAADNKSLLSRLTVGHLVLSSTLSSAKKVDELERTRKEAAGRENDGRMRGVLEEIREDRELVKRREERDRARRRRAREQRDIEERAAREASEWDRA